MHFWWEAKPTYDNEITQPTPDTLLAFIQQPDGSFVDATSTVFGSDLPQLGGASRKVSSKDINSDGIPDFAFAMNWEDLRPQDNPDSNAARPAVIISAPSGHYDVVQLGEASWSHGVEIIQANDNIFDIAFGGFTAPDKQVFRFSNDEFENVTEFYSEVDGAWSNTINSLYVPTLNATFLSSSYASPREFNEAGEISAEASNGFIIYLLSDEGAEQIYKWTIPPDIKMAPEAYPLQANIEVFLDYWDKPVAHAAIDAQQFYQESDGRVILTNKFSGTTIDDSAEIAEGKVLAENALTAFSTFEFYVIEENSAKKIGAIINEVSDINANFFDVLDLNSDGFFDLVVHPFSRPWEENVAETNNLPLIYLNDGTDNLILTPTESIFDVSQLSLLERSNGSQTGIFDFNNDGLFELAQFPENLNQNGDFIYVEMVT